MVSVKFAATGSEELPVTTPGCSPGPGRTTPARPERRAPCRPGSRPPPTWSSKSTRPMLADMTLELAPAGSVPRTASGPGSTSASPPTTPTSGGPPAATSHQHPRADERGSSGVATRRRHGPPATVRGVAPLAGSCAYAADPYVLVTTAGCLVLLYLIWWTTYVATHVEQRYTQRPPGEAGRDRRHDDQGAVADQQRPAGRPEVRRSGRGRRTGRGMGGGGARGARRSRGAPEFFCTVELLGPDGRRWEPEIPRDPDAALLRRRRDQAGPAGPVRGDVPGPRAVRRPARRGRPCSIPGRPTGRRGARRPLSSVLRGGSSRTGRS